MTHVGVGSKQRLCVAGETRAGGVDVFAGIAQWMLVEAAHEDGLDGPIEGTSVCQCASAGRFQARGAVRLLQTHDALCRAQAFEDVIGQ